MSEPNYAACVAFVRKQEGGNSDTAGDRGGRTGRGGITHATYDSYRAKKGLPRQDVFSISDYEIAEIYRANYWEPIFGDRLPAGQDLVLFDASINSGPGKANELRLAAGEGDVPALIRKICDERLSFMRALGSWRQFGRAWGRRVAACEALALRMAGALPSGIPAGPSDAVITHRRKGARAATGGVIAATGAHHFAGAGHIVIAAIVGVSALAIIIAAFNAWHHGQRADALASAVTQMKAADAAAKVAAIAAAAEASVKEKAIALEQAALSAAKAAIEHIPGQSNIQIKA